MPVTGLRSHTPGALIAAEMRDSNPFARFALAERCADELCQRSASSYPLLPIAPPFDESLLNPCIRENGGRVRCIPAVHVTGGWHSFVEEGLGPLLSAHPHVKLGDKGTCFNGWEDDPAGPEKWFGGWEVQPMADQLLVQSCTPLLTFYPSFPSGYLNAFLDAYWPCKAAEVAALKAAGRSEGEYYSDAMWSRCRPRALAAHDLAVGTGGLGHELTPPFVMRSVYGNRTAPRVVALLRSPIDRLETSFWAHPHYPKKYGNDADGLHAYAAEQTGAFAACESKHSARRCAFLFEMLEKQCATAPHPPTPPYAHPPTPPYAYPPTRWPYARAAAAAVLLSCLLSHPPASRRYADVFFHADQVIRGVYEPFVAEWRRALPASLHVLRAEDLYDAPVPTRAALFGFLGLQPPEPAESAGAVPRSYAQMHAATLEGATAEARAPPMAPRTRDLLAAFYRPHNARLATLLQDPRFKWDS